MRKKVPQKSSCGERRYAAHFLFACGENMCAQFFALFPDFHLNVAGQQQLSESLFPTSAALLPNPSAIFGKGVDNDAACGRNSIMHVILQIVIVLTLVLRFLPPNNAPVLLSVSASHVAFFLF